MDEETKRTDEEWWYDLSGRVLEDATTGSDDLVSILMKIFKRLPPEDAEVLLYDRNVLFICPQACSVRPFHAPDQSPWFVFLTTDVVEISENEATYIIAHELAHVFFEEWGGTEAVEGELKADRQVVKWGFERELRAVPENYLYGSGLEKFGKKGA